MKVRDAEDLTGRADAIFSRTTVGARQLKNGSLRVASKQ